MVGIKRIPAWMLPKVIAMAAITCVMLISGCDNSKTNPAESVAADATGGTTKESPSDRSPSSDSEDERGRPSSNVPATTDSVSATNSATPSDSTATAVNPTVDASARGAAELPFTADSNTPFLPQDEGIGAPTLPAEPAPSLLDETELKSRVFATIEPTNSNEPTELVSHLQEVDEAIADLVTVGSNNLVSKDVFMQFGMRLGQMKLDAGQKLANLASATREQRKAGVLAQLIALSHMSGLGDTQSGQQLRRLAEAMSESKDPDLSHQSRIVLLGFELQDLQNGVSSDPNSILEQAEGLFTRPEDRSFPEFMIIQQTVFVLEQMGFDQAADRTKQILVEEYQNSPDVELRSASWNFATGGSQALQNYNNACSAIGRPNSNPEDLLAAARGLYDEFPTAQTLEAMSRSVSEIEYSGFVSLSQRLADFLQTQIDASEPSPATAATTKILADHQARLDLIGKAIELTNLADIAGNELDWSKYENKVVLIDFWASWCVPCLEELPNLREVYDEYSEHGFEIIGINVEENAETAKEFINKRNMPWTNYRFQDARGFDAQFLLDHGIKAIPFIVLVGNDGVVREIHVRGNSMKASIKEALGLEASLIP